MIVGPDHRAFDEQSIDPARVLDRIGQAAARFQIERQRAGAEVDIQIEQRGGAFFICAEQPGQRRGDGRGADPAARADHRGRDMLFGAGWIVLLGIGEHRLGVDQRIAHLRG